MDIYISLCFYTGPGIMYRSLGVTETYVSPYPLTDVIQFDFKRADQILLRSSASPKKNHKFNRTDPTKRGTCGVCNPV